MTQRSMALDGIEALLGDVEPVGMIEVLNVLVVLVGTTELGTPTLEVVSVSEMSEMVLELDGLSAVLSCEISPTSMELDVASTVETISVLLVVDSVVSCAYELKRSIVGRADCFSVGVLEYSLLLFVDLVVGRRGSYRDRNHGLEHLSVAFPVEWSRESYRRFRFEADSNTAARGFVSTLVGSFLGMDKFPM